MACVNMFNNDQGMYNPRISFSNDFSDPQQSIKLENSYREAPVSSDFEFSLPSFAMNSADQLFCKGKLLPLQENSTKFTTLRDELLASDEEYEDVSPRIAKGAGRWRERLGLKRSPIVPKKSEKAIDEALERKDVDLFANFKGSF